MLSDARPANRWYLLILSTFTVIFCAAMPMMSMPVLFKEISEELGLSLVQIGTVWSMGPFAALFMSLIAGILIDRVSIKRIFITASILTGVFGISRGLSIDFWSLALSSFFIGLVSPTIPVIAHRGASLWFDRRQLGLANGVIASSVGVGFALAAFISASILSPLLGGWRFVLYLYGAIAIIIGLLWMFTMKESGALVSTQPEIKMPFREMISNVFRLKDIWLMGFSLFGSWGCIYAISGYLPLYLRDAGWSAISADGTLAVLNITSAVGAIPLSLLSDRIGSRKAVAFTLIVTVCICSLMLAVFDNAIVWILVVLIGFNRDATMALLITMNQEKVAGSSYSGTALGLQSMIMRAGPVFSPPIGNSLAGVSTGAPFLLWAAFAALGAISTILIKEKRRSARRTIDSRIQGVGPL